jgi:hypothetical protein
VYPGESYIVGQLKSKKLDGFFDSIVAVKQSHQPTAVCSKAYAAACFIGITACRRLPDNMANAGPGAFGSVEEPHYPS